jgi:hypothetical protein
MRVKTEVRGQGTGHKQLASIASCVWHRGVSCYHMFLDRQIYVCCRGLLTWNRLSRTDTGVHSHPRGQAKWYASKSRAGYLHSSKTYFDVFQTPIQTPKREHLGTSLDNAVNH